MNTYKNHFEMGDKGNRDVARRTSSRDIVMRVEREGTAGSGGGTSDCGYYNCSDSEAG